jgi:hypothetical protein
MPFRIFAGCVRTGSESSSNTPSPLPNLNSWKKGNRRAPLGGRASRARSQQRVYFGRAPSRSGRYSPGGCRGRSWVKPFRLSGNQYRDSSVGFDDWNPQLLQQHVGLVEALALLTVCSFRTARDLGFWSDKCLFQQADRIFKVCGAHRKSKVSSPGPKYFDQRCKELRIDQHDSARPSQVHQPIRDQLNIRIHGFQCSRFTRDSDAFFPHENRAKTKPAATVRDALRGLRLPFPPPNRTVRRIDEFHCFLKAALGQDAGGR